MTKTYELIDYCKDGSKVAIATTEATSLAEAVSGLATMRKMVGSKRAFIRLSDAPMKKYQFEANFVKQVLLPLGSDGIARDSGAY